MGEDKWSYNEILEKTHIEKFNWVISSSIYCRLDATEWKTNGLENREVETIQTEAKEKKILEKSG